MKTCTGCGQEYPETLEHFYQAIPGRLMARCKACHNNAKRSRNNTQRRARDTNHAMSPEYMEALVLMVRRTMAEDEDWREAAERRKAYEEAMA